MRRVRERGAANQWVLCVIACLGASACEYREQIGDWPDSGPSFLTDAGPRPDSGFIPDSGEFCRKKTCTQLNRNCGTVSDGCGGQLQCGDCVAPSECGGGGTPGVCGVNACGGCTNPPAGECWPSHEPTGSYTSTTYKSPGSCFLGASCQYAKVEVECPEDCTAGVCHAGSLCTLSNLCKAGLGCKWHSPTELRCKQVDKKRELDTCDERTPGFRCTSKHVCVRPPFLNESVCAYLCVTSSDCFGRGLQSAGVCVKDGSLGNYGWCR